MFQPAARHFARVQRVGNARLGEILGAFSYALDLTEGQPAGHSIRAAWIAVQLGMAAGLEGQELADCLYATLLKDLGCSSNAARVAELFVGDDRTLKQGFKLIGPDGADFLRFVEAEVGRRESDAVRSAARDHLLTNAAPILTGFIHTRCTQGATIARRLRFSENVAGAISSLDEHWDGAGMPRGLSGNAIPLLSRIALLAQVADVFYMAEGPSRALAEVKARADTWFDPYLVSLFVLIAGKPQFWAEVGAINIEKSLFALEPAQSSVEVDEDFLDDIAMAFGQVIDAKSPFTGGHSNRVAFFTDRLGEILGIPAEERRPLVRGAALHDIGKLGVSNRILDKAGPLDGDEWLEMKGHAGLTRDILARVGVMRSMAMMAGSHHERLDGKGYPLGLDARTLSLETRIISVADYFDAITSARPYRAAMPLDEALAVMARDVGSAIDGDVFAALQTMAAHGIPEQPLPKLPGVLRI